LRNRFTALFLAFAALAVPIHLYAQEVIDSICAIVDDEFILESEVGYGINSILLERGIKRPTQAQVAEAREQVILAYITQKILLARAAQETLAVEDRVVDKELERKFKQIVQQVGGEDKLEEYFERPVRQIKREMRKGVREGLLIDMVKRRRLGSPQVRRQDVIDFYEKHKNEIPTIPERVELSHILLEVAPSEESRNLARSKIERTLRCLEEGADFDSLAQAVSDDPSSENGGRLGFTNRGDLVPEYEEAAYPLESGEISPIILSRYGYHIVRMIERQGERISTQHILATLNPTEDDWRRMDSLASVLRERYLDGESFDSLAAAYSCDDPTKNKGGRLEVTPVEQLPDDFKATIAGLQEGETAIPFRTSFGVHIVRIEKRFPAHSLSLTEDWQMLEQYALSAKREEQFLRWLRKEAADHYIWPEALQKRISGT